MQDAIPTDSVLRRHYEASHDNTSQNKPPQNSGGFMGWLKRLFGG